MVEMSYRDALLDAGLLLQSSVPGVYGRSGEFEAIVAGLDRLISELYPKEAVETVRFPPIMPRSLLETSGFLKGFPNLAGTIHCFCGDEHAHRELLRSLDAGQDWTKDQQVSELSLTPAACYPVYPMVAGRGPLRSSAHIVDVASYCFRHEPSLDPIRMQAFRMREFVCLGAAESVKEFRDRWIERGRDFANTLALPSTVDVANDPFFGRGGTLMARSQRDQALKFELLMTVSDPQKPTACLSFNYHMDHFAEIWQLRLEDGSLAHTACVGFGFERLALALLRQHGFDRAQWPQQVRAFF